MKMGRELCGKLTHILFNVEEGDTSGFKAYAGLLKSFGEQLRFGHVGLMPEKLCKEIVSACPNMLCGADLYERDDWEERMLALSPALKRIGAKVDAEVEWQIFSRAARECSKLEEIVLHTDPEQAARAVRELFCVEKPGLKLFHFYVHGKGSGTQALHELSTGARSLEKFLFHGPTEHPEVFRAVARGTPMLRRVDIQSPTTGTSTQGMGSQEYVQRVTRAFRICRHLENIQVRG